jgi:hypothetical protein
MPVNSIGIMKFMIFDTEITGKWAKVLHLSSPVFNNFFTVDLQVHCTVKRDFPSISAWIFALRVYLPQAQLIFMILSQ